MASGASASSLLTRLVLGDATFSTDSGNSPALKSRLQIALLATVALSSAATALSIVGFQAARRSRRRTSLEGKAKGDPPSSAATNPKSRPKALQEEEALGADSAPSSADDSPAPRYLGFLPASSPGPDSYRNGAGGKGLGNKKPRKWDESLLREQLTRNYSFLGEEGMQKIRESFVVVVGAGGVGSWAALMLLRSGVSRIRIIDFDQVSLSSLNRHACATLADVGRPKVICVADYFAEIAPWAKIEAWVEIFKGEDAARLLGGNPDYVIDAIDNIETKVDLIKYCFDNNIKCFASMGAGAKADPSRIQISDITDTTEDPLAAAVRRRLRLLGIPPLPPKKQSRWSAEPDHLGKAGNSQKQRASAERRGLGRASKASAAAECDHLSQEPAEIEEKVSDRPTAAPRQSGDGLSRYSLGHLRRASSASSYGSAAFGTPLSTPVLEANSTSSATRAEFAKALPSPELRTSKPDNRRQDSDLREIQPESEADKAEILTDGEDEGTKINPEIQKGNYAIPCVYSTEKSDVSLLPLPEDEYERGRVSELSPLEQFRVRVLPVLGPIPAMFGLAAATYILCDLAGHAMEPLAHKRRRKVYDKIWFELVDNERRHPAPGAKTGQGPFLFNHEDILFLFEEVFSGRTVVPPHESLGQAQMLRWDSNVPLSWTNVALFSRPQAKIHQKQVLLEGKSPYAVWGEDAAKRMRVCQARLRYLHELREM